MAAYNGPVLKKLYSSQNVDVDIIAVHGLGANPDTTWMSQPTKDRPQGVHWLRDADMLPSLIPRSRISIFCYNSRWLGEAPVQNLDSLGCQLLALIHDNRSKSERSIPIILIAHSFGGIVIESALTCATSKERYPEIVQSVTGIIFLGTPFRGSPSVQQAILIANAARAFGYTSDKSLLDLLPNSATLADLLAAFSQMAIAQHMHIVCFWEQLRTEMLRHRAVPGWLSKWSSQMIVERSQAVLDAHVAIGLGTSHTKMNEFSGPDDANYRLLSGRVLEAVEAAPAVLLPRTSLTGLTLASTGSDKNTRELPPLPYLRNPDFIGRQGLLQSIQSALERGHRRAALHGLGGIGKTQIAIEYAYTVREQSKQPVYWIHAANRARFEESYRAIAEEAGLSEAKGDTEALLLSVKHWLEQQRTRWLLIVDNADDSELFSSTADAVDRHVTQYLPRSETGSLLYTSRNRKLCIDLVGVKATFPVGEMEDQECRQLLEQSLSDEIFTAADVTPLIGLLQNVPLALSQAAAFMEQNCISAAQYVKLFSNDESSLSTLLDEDFAADGRDPETHNAIFKTWKLSFDQLERQEPLSARILSQMAFLDRQAIPKELLRQDFDANIDFEKALGTLQAFSMITSDATQTYSLHRLVQVCIRSWLLQKGNIEHTANDTIVLLLTEFPEDPAKYENWQTCARYLPHAEAFTAAAGLLRYRSKMLSLLHCQIGLYLATQGKYSLARSHRELAMQLSLELNGPEHENTLAGLYNLSASLCNEGRYNEAEQLQTRVLEARRRILGLDHLDTLTSMHGLANTLKYQGRHSEAEELLVQVVAARRQVLGPEHPHTLISMSALATVIQNQQRYDEAEQLLHTVYEGYQRLHGPDHPDTLKSMSNLADVLSCLDRFQAAEKLQLAALEGERRVLGPEHPDTLISLSNLAAIYDGEGRYEEALKLQIEELEISQRTLGPDRPDTLISMANMAITRYKLGQRLHAIQLMAQVAKLREQHLGIDHPATQSAKEWVIFWIETKPDEPSLKDGKSPSSESFDSRQRRRSL